MRRIDFEMSQADIKRISLASRFEEFGLQDHGRCGGCHRRETPGAGRVGG